MCFYMKKNLIYLLFSGETHRAFIAAFFRTHKMRLGKMKKFVARWASLLSKWLKIPFFRLTKAYTSPPSVRNMRKSGSSVPKQRGPLLEQIISWLAEARLEELRKLPEMLRATQLTSMASKLEKAFSDIQERNSGCSLIWQWSAVFRILPAWNYYWTRILCWIAC